MHRNKPNVTYLLTSEALADNHGCSKDFCKILAFAHSTMCTQSSMTSSETGHHTLLSHCAFRATVCHCPVANPVKSPGQAHIIFVRICILCMCDGRKVMLTRWNRVSLECFVRNENRTAGQTDAHFRRKTCCAKMSHLLICCSLTFNYCAQFVQNTPRDLSLCLEETSAKIWE